MTPPRHSETDSIRQLRHDHTSLAASFSNLALELRDIKSTQADHRELHAVAKEKEKHLDEKLDDIKSQIAGIYSLGKSFFLAFIGACIVAVVTFVVKGGLNVPPPG